MRVGWRERAHAQEIVWRVSIVVQLGAVLCWPQRRAMVLNRLSRGVRTKRHLNMCARACV